MAADPVLPASYVVGLIQRLFPFSVMLDQELRVVQFGPRLPKVCPAITAGVPFTEVLGIFRPRMKLSYANLLKEQHSVFFIDVKATKVRMRGQMLYEEALGAIFFLGSPWLTSMAQLEAAKLKLDDFTIHEPIVDLLSMVQALQLALDDAKQFGEASSRQRDQLREINSQMERNIRELDQRNRDMRLVMDNVSQGLLTLNMDGGIAPERSRIIDEWLGAPGPGQKFWDFIARWDPPVSKMFAFGWEALLEDALPLALCLDQMPRRMTAGPAVLAISYKPVMASERVINVLLVISNITAELEYERHQAEQQELLTVLEKIALNRVRFIDFFTDATELVGFVTQPGEDRDVPEVRRRLHTLKGNCALFGLRTVTSLCHQIETHMEETDSDMVPADREELERKWSTLSAKLARLVGDKSGIIEIHDYEHTSILEAIASGRPRADILQMISAWRHPPISERLEHFADQIQEVSRSLGKGVVEVTIQAHGLRYSSERWAEFWMVFAHVVRNAVDHGLEAPGERLACGKPPSGHIALRATAVGPEICIEVQDDGRGIDWVALSEKGRARGLPHCTKDELVAVLMTDGVSTREQASEYSGRGVGMAAVRNACARLRGRIEVSSDLPGQGTTWRFYLPAELGEVPAQRARPDTSPMGRQGHGALEELGMKKMRPSGPDAFSVWKLYDGSASLWVRDEPRSLSDFTGRPATLALCEPVAGARVLDLGCGEGYCSRRLRRAMASEVVGVDLSEGMIQAAKAQEAREPLGIRYQQGDATDLSDFEDGEFDLVLSMFMFNYLSLDQTARCMAEVARVLRPGGRFVFAAPHPSFAFLRSAAPPFYFAVGALGYFSGRDHRFEGQIWKRDGSPLGVQLCHKTVEDYFDALREAGFNSLPVIKELHVTPEIEAVDPGFFGPLVGYPLHLAMRVAR